MGRLGAQVRESWPQELEPIKKEEARAEQKDRLSRAAELADSLAASAEAIPTAVPASELSGSDRAAFQSLAQQLRGGAEQVGQRARANDTQGMDHALGQVRRTCTQCHEQFREIAGPLRFGF